MASYTYDAWGNIISKSGTLADLNPFRYRSYYYDNETYFYYLQSRYYDPAIGRFVNGDAYGSTGQGIIGHNMFAYCGNNPVDYVDPEGSRYVKDGSYCLPFDKEDYLAHRLFQRTTITTNLTEDCSETEIVAILPLAGNKFTTYLSNQTIAHKYISKVYNKIQLLSKRDSTLLTMSYNHLYYETMAHYRGFQVFDAIPKLKQQWPDAYSSLKDSYANPSEDRIHVRAFMAFLDTIDTPPIFRIWRLS